MSLADNSPATAVLENNNNKYRGRCFYRTLSGTELTCLGHQVAGQAPLLKREDGKVCKPLVTNEQSFYEKIQRSYPEYIPFVPKYHGVSTVALYFDGAFVEEDPANDGIVSWGLNLFRKKHSKLTGDAGPMKTEYIVLQDLTHNYKRPCILDLKMGTRQHGLDATEKKRRSMMEKCAATTSGSLGFRVCGLEVYHPTNCKYVYRDKYYGRKLTPGSVQEALIEFVNNGNRFRDELWSPILRRIQQLIALFERHRSFRFYGSSLLMIYEGACGEEMPDEHKARVNIKMVDFAHTYEMEDSNPTALESDDSGYLFGLKNLFRIMSNLARLSQTPPGQTI
mmetsp:Transcript_26108/g.42780  ORF Transcript_26108/g.42780 Transcript_26108/m.42780 type:complete len:337 (-) Transcript_26108:639-1649(-)|eukprot:CAMPEP_0184652802 /NCGR_PEP_ID=MMETSP0308-20130426/10524_1 /TAXON_ID=38269 /ORGANISM="Gloeochaete witrockiana, Strain SAG 46.84" /LENGTH=336 /DNA_ID=CAMNT_0027087911 /DNA_START=173 /DNA_END=1186 /DNA_ORIENTATION=-